MVTSLSGAKAFQKAILKRLNRRLISLHLERSIAALSRFWSFPMLGKNLQIQAQDAPED